MQRLQQLRMWRFVLLAISLALTIVLVNCSTPTPRLGSSSGPNVLVFGSGGQPVSLDPGNITDGNSITVQTQIYNRLVEFKPGTTEFQPSLAVAWSVSDDEKTWTFKLRQGVTFHDDTPFNAEAVKFNIDRWWDPKHPQGYRDAGKNYEIWRELLGGFKGDPDSLVQQVTVKDDFTLAITLQQPFAAFPAAIGSGYFGIASPTAIQRAGASYGTAGSVAVGTGAFRFQDWRTGDRILLSKNRTYWKPDLPKVDQLIIRFITDPSARLAQLRAGQLDFTVDLAPDQRSQLQQDATLEAVLRPSLNVGYLALNPSYKPLASQKVRQAIAHAINKSAIVQAFWGDLGRADPHFLPPVMAQFCQPDLADYEYNPNKAKQLLAEAGYSNGFDLDLWYMPVSRPYFPTPKPIAEALAADLTAVGIRINLQTKDWAAYLADRKQPPGFQAFMLGWIGDYGDPDNFYYPHFGPGATFDLGGWKSQPLLELLAKGRASSDMAVRTQIYQDIDQILHQEVLRLPIVHADPLLARHKRLQGWVPSPLGTEPFELLSLGGIS